MSDKPTTITLQHPFYGAIEVSIEDTTEALRRAGFWVEERMPGKSDITRLEAENATLKRELAIMQRESIQA